MGKFKIGASRELEALIYTTEKNHRIQISVGLFEEEKKIIKLKDINHWESPYEDEEITIEEKKEILQNIVDEYNKEPPYKNWGVVVDMSDESNIIHYNELLDILYFDYNVRKTSIYKDGEIVESFSSSMEMSESYRLNFSGDFPYAFYKYCELPKDEYIKFKKEISKSKEIQYLLTEFAKWKINEDKENINQKKFNYGLYALEMLLCEITQEEVKEITKKYIEIAKEKKLSFEPFMKRNRELNKIINEFK